MHTRTLTIIGIIILAIAVGGYAFYSYAKNKPPQWLTTIVTKTTPPPPLPEGDAAPFSVPDGFVATIYSREVPGARVMLRDPRGVLLVSSTKEGTVVALPDEDGNGVADRTVPVLSGLNQPHGLFVRCEGADSNTGCMLYVAQTDALTTYAYDPTSFSATNPQTVASFPSGAGHYTRTLLPHPDGENLLVSVGSSCNVCREGNAMRATVQAFNFATQELSTVATGLRNTVFMAINPVSGEIWGTDNGRDLIGDDIPPDEVNEIEAGTNYGWPLCYGNKVRDTDFGDEPSSVCEQTVPALIELPAHVAALGLAFIPEEGWPEEYRHDLLVAYHGSWNRSEPSGYKVVRIGLSQNASVEGKPVFTDFMSGFLPAGTTDEGDALGRPVAVLAEPGGVVYVSDDRAGAIYRITVTQTPE